MTEKQLEFLSLKGGCTGSSESTVVKMLHCWKSHVMTNIDTDKSLKRGIMADSYDIGRAVLVHSVNYAC